MMTTRGFALVTTLLLLTLAAVVLADISRRSMKNAATAVENEEQLQRKWAMASIRSAVLPRAERIIAGAEGRLDDDDNDDDDPPLQKTKTTITIMPKVIAELKLNDTKYELVISDEQAKANLNVVINGSSKEVAAKTVRRLVGDKTGRLNITLSPDPTDKAFEFGTKDKKQSSAQQEYARENQQDIPDDLMSEALQKLAEDEQEDIADPRDGKDSDKKKDDNEEEQEESVRKPDEPRAFASWAQVFSEPDPAALFGAKMTEEDDDWYWGTLEEDQVKQRPLDFVTCWGDGKLNLLRATPESIEAVAGTQLVQSQLKTLIKERKKRPDLGLEELLKLIPQGANRQAFEEACTDSSRCHSLFIQVADEHHTAYELSVIEQVPLKQPKKPAKVNNPNNPAVQAQQKKKPDKDLDMIRYIYSFSW